MRVTQAVVHRGGGGGVERAGIRCGWWRGKSIKRATKGHCRWHFARIQVGGEVHQPGRVRVQQRGVDLNVTQLAGHVARGVHLKALQARARIAHHEALAIHFEVTRTGVLQRAVHTQLVETAAADGQIQGVIGEADVALAELLCHRRQAHALADGIAPGAEQAGGKDVREFRTGCLVAHR